MKSEFYYGLPQEQWDSLLVQAEDLLRDKNIGSHLVGLYPRIFTEKSSQSAGLFCLYVDSVEPRIDPYLSRNYQEWYQFHTPNGPILMVELWAWAWFVLYGTSADHYYQHKVHLAPFNAVIHQDDSLDTILEHAYNFTNDRSQESAKKLGAAVATLYRLLS